MRVVFMGTPEFAVPSLKSIMEEHQVVAVVTAPDKAAGRGRHLNSSAVKKFALVNNLQVLQPLKLRNKHFIEALKNLKPDIFIVVAFRMLPELVWSIPPRGTYNLHASLLPKYRGAAPIQRAIMMGESTTGLTIFRLNSEIDTGDIVDQLVMPIAVDETGGELYEKLMNSGGDFWLKCIRKIMEPNFVFLKQNHSQASNAPKIYREDCQIEWNQDVSKVYNHIRALNPIPGAWFLNASRIFKIFMCRPIHQKPIEFPGTIIINDGQLWVACRSGYINVLEIQQEGKRKMTITEFINGHSLKL